MSRDEENLDEPQANDGDGATPNAGSPQSGKKKAPGEAGQADAEDLLFETTGEAPPPSDEFGSRQQFAEDSQAKWGGHQMDADEIGIPIEKQPGYLQSDDDFALDSDQELELVDDESQLETQAAGDGSGSAGEDGEASNGDEDLVLDEGVVDDTVYAEAADQVVEQDQAGEPGKGEFFVLDEAEKSGQLLHEQPLPADNYPVEEGWEPVAGTAAEGEQWLEPEPTAEPVQGEVEDLAPQMALVGADGEAMGDQYQEEAAPELVAAAPRRRGHILRMFASAAAAAIVVGAGAVVVLRPEWLGLHFEPQLVERVQVARPNVQVRVAPPSLPAVEKPQVAQVTPTPTPTPVTPQPPQGEGDPTPTVPVTPTPDETQPAPQQPVAQADPDPVEPTTPNAQTGATPETKYVAVGDTMWIGDFDTRGRQISDWAQVRLGAKAFAQLANGNFFIGSVKAVNSDALVLTIPAGEVTLFRQELTKVATLDSQEYAELQQATTGFLRLSNRNRLVGAILKSVVDDNYVLQMRSDRVVVPKSAVEQVVAQPGMDGLRFSGQSDEEEWLRGVAAQQLRAMSTGVPAAPQGEGKGKPEKKAGSGKLLPLPEAKRTPPSAGKSKAK